MKLNKALLVVDVQNDFCPNGALAVPEGDRIIATINKYIDFFSRRRLPIFVTRDWHPKKTAHFKKYGGVWPVHCVQGTKGVDFHPKLKLPKEVILLYKGMDQKKDSYSAFYAEDENGRSFFNLLKILGIGELYIAGLATDYCVKFSVHDAILRGLKVNVLVDAVKGVNLKPLDSEKAIKKMIQEGAKTLLQKDVLNK